MKKINITKRYKISTLLLLFVVLIFSACTKDNGEGWSDERYTTNFEYFFDNINPKTGVAFTEDDIAELGWNPAKEGRYEEGEAVLLKLVLPKQITGLTVTNTVDGTELFNFSSAETDGNKYKIEIATTLPDLGLVELKDNIFLNFNFKYQDGAIGTVLYKITYVKIEVIDPNADLSKNLVGYWRFNNPDNLGQASIGNDLILNGAASQTSVTGVSADDGAAKLDVGSWYDVDHGMAATGGDNVNTFTMLWDVNVASSDLGKYICLLQYNTANDSDGSVYINPDAGFWFNGGPSDFAGTIQGSTWHRVVLTVDAPEIRLYVDGVLIYTDDTLATPDGKFSLDLSKFIILGENSSNDGNGEDNPISITEFMLFDTAFASGTIESFPAVTEPALPSISQDLVGRWKFDDAADLTKASYGKDLALNGAATHSPISGVSAEDGAAKVDVGSWYDVDHGMAASGGDNVNTFTMIWDVNVASSDLGKYICLLQYNTANDSDGSVYINPDAGFWFNGGPSDFAGAIQGNTWHRIVLTVDAPEIRLYVDGILIYSDDTLATPDGKFSLDPSKFIILGENSSNDGNGEDNPISITDFLLFDKAFSQTVVEGLPTVDMPVF